MSPENRAILVMVALCGLDIFSYTLGIRRGVISVGVSVFLLASLAFLVLVQFMRFSDRRPAMASGEFRGPSSAMKTVILPGGERVPALGQGTWQLAKNDATRAEEIATLRLGLDLGATLIDTAEMYGDGAVEELVAEAIAGRRDEVFLVSKVYPHNASRQGALDACARSLRRLRTDRIDLYLLHWRGDIPLSETIEAFLDLQQQGKIRHYGVSNLDLGDMEEVWSRPGGTGVVTNQVLYNLARRGIEWDLLPRLRERRVPVMAYSPIDQGKLARHSKLVDFASRHGMTPAQVSLAWLLAHDDVMVIPKTGDRQRLVENLSSLDHQLTKEQLAELDRLFPPPRGPHPLEMI